MKDYADFLTMTPEEALEYAANTLDVIERTEDDMAAATLLCSILKAVYSQDANTIYAYYNTLPKSDAVAERTGRLDVTIMIDAMEREGLTLPAPAESDHISYGYIVARLEEMGAPYGLGGYKLPISSTTDETA